MAWIPGGTYTMGTDDPKAPAAWRPAHRVRVHGFWLDANEVTNRDFAAFVAATKHVTTAEKPVDWSELSRSLPPGTPKPSADVLRAGAAVFTPPDHAVPLDDARAWWKYLPGADWRHPEGPSSTIEGREDHPVVQVSWDDATAYAAWAGKRLPTEAEWERAARGGVEGAKFVWGDDPPTDEAPRCNCWQGEFPWKNTAQDRFPRTAPVRSFPANPYGLFDVAGNVWEWCADRYRADAFATGGETSCHEMECDPKGPSTSWDPDDPLAQSRVLRGGSYLCHRSYCEAYRPSARRGLASDTGMGHVGFRCALDESARRDRAPAPAR
jgi:formylglycine-generating enzyme required for sulfatase activity